MSFIWQTQKQVQHELVCRTTSLRNFMSYSWNNKPHDNKNPIWRTADQPGSCYCFQWHFDNPHDTAQRCCNNYDLEILAIESQTLLLHHSRPVGDRLGSWSREHTSFYILPEKGIGRIRKILLWNIFGISVDTFTGRIIHNHFTCFDIGKICCHSTSLRVWFWGDEKTTRGVYRLLWCREILRFYSVSHESANSRDLCGRKNDNCFLVHSLCLHKDILRG